MLDYGVAAGLRAASTGTGAVILIALFWAALVSQSEGEKGAGRRIGFLGVLAAAPFLLAPTLPDAVGAFASGAVLSLGILSGLLFLLPIRGRNLPALGTPVPGVDERDIMFSRATLEPGTERFREYYHRHPETLALDETFRREPGLLSPGSAHFHREGFAVADAAFWTIEMLRPFVEGAGGPVGVPGSRGGPGGKSPPGARLGGKVGGSGVPASREPGVATADPDAVTAFLKAWTLKMGAHSVGVTELRPPHLYTHVGRGAAYGQAVDLDHRFALALTVEMDKSMVDRAPRAPTVMESGLQYLRSGVMAVQVADTIRRLGYGARAHVDGNYRVICPLVAKDAGLGEIGRMGLLMTPRLGPRVRIAVVTTDMPLAPDPPAPAPTTLDFCLHCRKCADACPARAIPRDDPEEDHHGVLRWKIDAEACFTLWGRLGTDCARCMSVCPYSHPDNLLHGLVRWGIRNNRPFRRAALHLDDFVYGRRPPPKPELEWMRQQSQGPVVNPAPPGGTEAVKANPGSSRTKFDR